jgi:hypothetical protein
VFLLSIYDKSEMENIHESELNTLIEIAKAESDADQQV